MAALARSFGVTAASPLKCALTMLVSIKTAVLLSVDSLTGFVDGVMESVGFGRGHAARGLCQSALPLVALRLMHAMNQFRHMLKLGWRQLLQLFHNQLNLAHTARNYSTN